MQREEAPLDLPAALVEDMLRKSSEAGSSLAGSMAAAQEGAGPAREWLDERGWLRRGPSSDAAVPTACGIDGSYVLDHMLATSIVACAAVAVEGFVPPKEDGFWQVRHRSFVGIEAHSSGAASVARGLMRMMEADLAARAPHGVVLLDGSAASQIIHVNQAVSAARAGAGGPESAGALLEQKYAAFLGDLATVLESHGRTWASLPKFTSRSELGAAYRRDPAGGARRSAAEGAWPGGRDDRSMMTAVLEEGEYTEPIPVAQDGDEWHLPLPTGEGGNGKAAMQRAVGAMGRLHVLYYKPRRLAPALRVEVAGSVARDAARLDGLLSSLRYQCPSYAVMEPYPLYAADRMVKSLGGVVPVLRQSAVQRVAAEPGIALEDAVVGMRGFRTEVGL